MENKEEKLRILRELLDELDPEDVKDILGKPQFQKSDNDLLTFREAAEYMNVSYSTIRVWARRRLFDVIVLGRRTKRVELKALKRFKEARLRKRNF